MKIEVSNGEIVDKYTILLLKQLHIKDEDKLANIAKEFDVLIPLLSQIKYDPLDFKRLYNTNSYLWIVEDELRICEKQQQFDDYFVELARKVYHLNDERASIKKKINIDSKSELTEEKSYEPWK